MGKYAAMLVALLLVAAAFFLPVRLSRWQDEQLLDDPHVTSYDKEREGFAESTQLSAAEKLLLLRSGTLTQVDLGGETVQGLYVVSRNARGEIERRIEHIAEFSSAAAIDGKAKEEVTVRYELEADEQEIRSAQEVWDQRLNAVWSELGGLQSLGGLPELWGAEVELEYTGGGEVVYMDPDGGVRFPVFSLSLSGHPYSISLTLDEQSGRILSFVLTWARDAQLNWGGRGPDRFGGVWRDYWGLDSVSSTWYSDYIREILSCPEESLRSNGDYNANGQVVFAYDGQSLPISLSNWVSSSRNGALFWN